MKTIEEHNAERIRLIPAHRDPWSKTGISCPKCGGELMVNRSVCMTSDPPQTPVKCSECDYSGSILS